MAVIATKKYQINEVVDKDNNLRVLHPETESTAVIMTNQQNEAGSLADEELWDEGDSLDDAMANMANVLGAVKETADSVETDLTTVKNNAVYYEDIFSDGTHTKLKNSIMPSYVDDVLEYANSASLPTTGEAGKIYVTTNDNLTYRWTGSQYTEISKSLAIGETSSTAYAGDKGKALNEAVGNIRNLTTDTNGNSFDNLVGAINYAVATAIDANDNAGTAQNDVEQLAGDLNDGTKPVLAVSKSISLSGDATGSASLNNKNSTVSIAVSLANSGVAAGVYSVVQVDAKGRVLAGNKLIVIGGTETAALNSLAVGGIWFKEV